jgi:hypothetical protein
VGATLVQEQTGTKEPLLAGVLSAIVPGVGSYYAGNSGHGTRHLLIAGGAMGLVLAGATLWATETIDDCLSGDCGNSSGVGNALMAVGYGAYIVNWAWSIGAAVGDANGHNRAVAARTTAGSVTRVEPIVSLSTVPSGSARTETRFGLRLVRRF